MANKSLSHSYSWFVNMCCCSSTKWTLAIGLCVSFFCFIKNVLMVCDAIGKLVWIIESMHWTLLSIESSTIDRHTVAKVMFQSAAQFTQNATHRSILSPSFSLQQRQWMGRRFKCSTSSVIADEMHFHRMLPINNEVWMINPIYVWTAKKLCTKSDSSAIDFFFG